MEQESDHPPAAVSQQTPMTPDQLLEYYRSEDPGSYPVYERAFESYYGAFDRELIVPCPEFGLIRQTDRCIEVLCPQGVDPCLVGVKPVGGVHVYDLIYVGQKVNTNGKFTQYAPVRFHIPQKYYKQFTMTWDQFTSGAAVGRQQSGVIADTVAIDLGMHGRRAHDARPDSMEPVQASSSWCQII